MTGMEILTLRQHSDCALFRTRTMMCPMTQLNVDTKLSELTIGEISQDLGCTPLQAAMRLYNAFGKTNGVDTHKTQKTPQAAAQAARGAHVDVRTKAGRDAYDESVFGYVAAHGPHVSAAEIRKAVGGSSLNVRAALNRLIEREKVTYEGRARATRYSIA